MTDSSSARMQLEIDRLTGELDRTRRRLLRCRVDLAAVRGASGNGSGTVPSDLSFLRDIAVAGNSRSASVEEMLAYTLRRTCEHYGWEFGVAFRSTWGLPSALGLTPPIVHATDPVRFMSLERLVRAEAAPLSDRLPVRAFSESRPLWSDDLSANLPAPMAAAAVQAGLRMIMVFPVTAGSEPVAVLKFYLSNVIEPDDDMLDTMSGVCTQLAHVIQRDDLARQLLELTVYEQDRVTRDLHEAVGQELAGLALTVESMSRRESGNGGQRQTLERVAGGLRQVLVDIQSVARGLVRVPDRANALGEMLVELGWLAERNSSTQMTCVVEVDPVIDMKDPDVTNHLYRIAQEALQNAISHSRCRRVRIRLWQDEQRISLDVDDDGLGIAEHAIRGQGMRSMYQRARLIGGRLEIQGLDGTHVHLSVPRIGVG
ncbi:MAG TPA: ATP-binding protein [Candidatus Eisenbacteria bacterium]